MTKEMELKIKQVALYIIENEATIKDTANYFNMSTSSIKKYINDDNRLKSLDEKLYNKVKDVQEKVAHEGHIKGGKEGSRENSFKYSDYEIIEVIETMLSNSMTLEEAEEYFSIPKSTIYDRVMSYPDKKVVMEMQALFDSNKKDAPTVINK